MRPDHQPPSELAYKRAISPLQNARVFSHHGVVINAENQLHADLSPDLRPPPSGHRLLNYHSLPPVVDLQKEAFLLPAPSSHKNYFHWLIESVPKLRLAPAGLPILTPLSRPFHREALLRAGVAENNWIELKKDSHFQLYQLHALPPVQLERVDINYLNALFSPKMTSPPTRKIYISRRDSWRRRARNEDELIAILEKNGFEIHSLNGLSISEQAQLFSEASHLITPHGAALANLVFCQKSTNILELFASNYLYPHYEKIAKKCDLSYQRHISPTEINDPDFTLDLPSFATTLDDFLS